ncbi:MAG: DUF3455 domain-containing protein [Thermoanaerobaculia bacterium]|nr:DUF3455 domain-containing protein [Thermoanaerobaculia bacterium]
MTRSTNAGLARGLFIAALLAFGAAPVALADDMTPLPVPEVLEVPEGSRAFLVAHAFGTQNYVCLPRVSGPGLGWTFFGPQATLFGDESGQLATHFLSANPAEGGTLRATWQHSRDSSSVWAQAIQSSSDPAFVAPGAVPWLLLRVTGAETGPTGGRRLTATSYIQRVNTDGGIAPAGDCPAVGAKLFVPYTADYVLYRARR